MGMHVVISGNPVDGFEIYGPFTTGVAAHEWVLRALPGDDWWIMPLNAPTA